MFQSPVLTSTSAGVRQEEQTRLEKGITQQLQVAQNSEEPDAEPTTGDGEVPSMKMEVGLNELVNHEGTDPFWRSNSLAQASQVIP